MNADGLLSTRPFSRVLTDVLPPLRPSVKPSSVWMEVSNSRSKFSILIHPPRSVLILDPSHRQLMSKPIPPGEITPSSASMAATPPIGKPYPQWMSGIAKDGPTMPGRVATLAACSGALSSRSDGTISSEAKIIASVLMPAL